MLSFFSRGHFRFLVIKYLLYTKIFKVSRNKKFPMLAISNNYFSIDPIDPKPAVAALTEFLQSGSSRPKPEADEMLYSMQKRLGCYDKPMLL